MKTTTIAILFLVSLPLISCRVRSVSFDPCNTQIQSNPFNFRSDQITVLINGYSESRFHLLRSIAIAHSSNPIVAAVIILWGNPKTSRQALTQLSINLTSFSGSAPISLLRQSSDSLNSRFLPRSTITTRAVAICDDDIEIDSESFAFAFKIWSTRQDKLIGFFARSHDFDISNKTWIYNAHHDKYSIILTKFMILRTSFLHKYTCGGIKWDQMRGFVDEMVNCEDILMNFLVAAESNSGPIFVEAKKLRDHGDARNEEHGLETNNVRQVGLSSRKEDHRKRRGECIRKFHKILGGMPLKYSYGKLVNSVGEQGLCEKGGKLVFCDQQIFI